MLGVLAARRVNGWPDTLIWTLGLVFYAMPGFWLGLMLIVLFRVKLAWLPPGGFENIGAGLPASTACSISPPIWCCRCCPWR